MENLKILVAYHKPYPIYQNEIYTPIHVGRSVSVYKDEMSDLIGDDTGDNISEKNPMYCELTAQYWAWKNIHDVNYIGFCHYRRIFDLDMVRIQHILSNHDAIVSKFVFDHPMWREIVNYVSLDDLSIMLMVLKKKYPEYEETVISYLYGNVLYPKNMFICSKKLFDGYANWLFDILFECEKIIRLSEYTRGKRVFAYLGEYLLPVYLMHHNYRLKVVDYNSFEGLHRKLNLKGKIITKLILLYQDMRNNIGFHSLYINRPDSIEKFIPSEVLIGFENDGIKIE